MKSYYELLMKFMLILIGSFIFAFCLIFTAMTLYLSIQHSNLITNDMIVDVLESSTTCAVTIAFTILIIIIIGNAIEEQ